MRCQVAKIITPQKYQLNGLWFGPERSDRSFIFVHGLTSNAFSNHGLVVPLVDDRTAVLTFSNRGSHKIAKVKKLDKRRKKGYKSLLIGEAHEVFSDCVDDIQGVVDFVKGKGVEDVYLVGHSTGCQKSIYYLSQRGKQKQVRGVVLLAPVSDYAAIQKFVEPKVLSRAEKKARELVRKARPHDLLPLDIWPQMHDAQRFLSLYTPESEEEIFSYAVSETEPKTLQKVHIPILTIFGSEEEYADRPISEIVEWFEQNCLTKSLTVSIIEGALHNFGGYEDEVVQQIKSWVES